MSDILTHSEQNAIHKIDDLMNTYCEQCLLKSHIRKTEGKTQAHHFALMNVQWVSKLNKLEMNCNRR